MDNPRRVYAFYDDFTSPALKKDWVKNNYGKWIVQNGRLLGDTMAIKGRDYVEVALYLKSGFSWRDIEVELDILMRDIEVEPGEVFCRRTLQKFPP